MKRKLTKFILICIIFVTAFRFAAHGFIQLENALYATIENMRVAYVAEAATTMGYVLPSEQASYNPEMSIDDIIEREALRHKLNPAFIRAIIKQESNFKPQIVSSAGAIGLMQVMPSNAKWCGVSVDELYIPLFNIMCGTKKIASDIEKYKGDVAKALMYYNGGNSCFDGRQNNPCKETKDYPVSVLKHLVTDIRG